MTTEAASDLDLFEAEATGQPVTKSTVIPDKYAGKTTEELIQMHQNAERALSRQGSELGQVRRMADEIIALKKPTTETRQETVREPVTVQTLLNDPEKALNSAVAASDVAQRTVRAEARIDRLEGSIAEQQFVTKHANFAEDLKDPTFLDWMNKSPTRARLGAQAATKDFGAATELFDLWNEHKELTGTKTSTEGTGTQGTAVVPAAKSVPTGVKSAPAQIKGKPVYSRLKLMDLRAAMLRGEPSAVARWRDPTFQENMNLAYAEQRVR